MSTTHAHQTTDATLSSDLKASLLKSDLEDRDVCLHRQAERTARLCVSLFEPDTFDAAMWKGAEALYAFMDGRAEAVPLEQREVPTRALYLTMAVQCFASIRLALEGGFPQERMVAAAVAIANHRMQLAERRHLKVVQS